MSTIKEIDRMLETNLTEFKYQDTDNVIEDVCSIIDSAQSYAYQAVNIALVKRNWLIGYRIAKEELKGLKRAEYGEKIIKELSRNLTEKYGKGFDRVTLYRCYRKPLSLFGFLQNFSSNYCLLTEWTI